MPSGIGVANPKFSKSGRKPKKTRHCTNPKIFLTSKRKEKRRLLSKRCLVENRLYDTSRTSLGEYIFQTLIEKKRMKNRGKDTHLKSGIWVNF